MSLLFLVASEVGLGAMQLYILFLIALTQHAKAVPTYQNVKVIIIVVPFRIDSYCQKSIILKFQINTFCPYSYVGTEVIL